MVGLLLVFGAAVIAYEMGYKGTSAAQMRADIARVLQLPSAGRLQAAAQVLPIANPGATGAAAATSGTAAAGTAASSLGQNAINAVNQIIGGLFSGQQPVSDGALQP